LGVASIKLPETLKPVSAEVVPVDITCFGESNGRISVAHFSGGGGKYLYQVGSGDWKDTSIVTTDLAPGNYKVYLKDSGYDCPSVFLGDVGIEQPPTLEAVTAGRLIPVDVSCAGLSDGSISVALLSGGSGAYQYRVNNGVWKDTSVITSDLLPGDYRIYIRDKKYECHPVDLGSISIKQPDTLMIDRFEVVQPSCELNNGAILTEIRGGNGLYKYEWLRNGSSFYKNDTFLADTIIDLADTLTSGDYHLNVIDSRNCILEKSVTLDEYKNPSLAVTSFTDARCYGESSGEVSVLMTPGINNLSKYYIKGAGYTADNPVVDLSGHFTNLKQGNYKVYAADILGCFSDSIMVGIDQPDSVYLTADIIRPIFRKGALSGKIQSTAFGGNVGLKEIHLFNSQGTCIDSSFQRSEFPFALDSLRAGKYAIQVEDVKGCSFKTDSIWVKEPDAALSFAVTNKQNARCKSQVGSFTVQASGGWGGYSYKRDSYNAFYTRNTFDNLYAGNYIITVKDSLGATFSDTVVIDEPKENLLSWASELLPPTCSNNGELKVGVMGGTAPYSLLDEATNVTLPVVLAQTVSLKGLAAGSHAMRVTDANGCRFNLEAVLPDTSMMRVSLAIVYPDNTSGGAIQASVAGGVKPYTYQWKNRFGANLPDNSALLSNKPSGHYSLRVTGNDGCSKDTTVYLPGVSDAPFTISKLGNETSLSAQNGYCKLTSKFSSWKSFDLITPANELLKFNPSDSTSLFYCNGDTVSLQNLKGGNYFISGITAGDTTVYANFTIEPYRPFLIRSVDTLHVSTIGGANGEIVLVVTGGGGGNQFVWSRISGSGSGTLVPQNYPESSILSNLAAGSYRVVVTDRYGNILADTVRVEEPGAPLSISIAVHNNESCKTYKDANVTLKAEGGWGDYQFRHDSAAHYVNGSFFDTLNVRNHYFYLIDKMGVVDSVALDITEPDYLTSRVALVDSVNCKHAGDGRVEFEVKGGSAPYRLASIITPDDWTPGTVATGIAAGEYRYIFTDTNSCVGQDTVEVNMYEPDSLLFNKIDIKHTTCNIDNGAIKVLMQGGTKPYTYAWRNFSNDLIGSDSSVDTLMRNGLYTLDVYDYHNCHQHIEKRINPSTNPVVTNVDTTEVLCYGGNTGKAFVVDVEPGEPFAPYRFTWSNGDTSKVASGYPKGIHFVTISDTNKCSSTKYFEVTQPDSVRIVTTNLENVRCFGYNDASINIEGRGGVGGYTYRWSTGDTTSRIKNLYKGVYRLVLNDSNQCFTAKNFEIVQPDSLRIALVDSKNTRCYGFNDAFIKVEGQGGVGGYAYSWSTGDTTRIASNLYKGVYRLVLSDKNQCSTAKYFEVTQPDSLRIAIADRKNAHCFGYNDAFLLAEGQGGVGGYAYRWSTGDTTALAKNLYKGVYGLKLTDANKCLTEESFTIDEPAKQLVDLGDDIKMCPGNSRILDGQDFATHKWFTKQGVVSNERYYTAKEANDYYLEVTNSIGCFAWDTLNLSIGNDALKADFLLSSQAKMGDTLSLFELSNIPLDSLQWDYDNSAFSKIGPANPDYVLFLKTLKQGIYNINLYAFSGGCVSVATKQVEIIADTDTLPNDGDLGYKDPLIKSFTISPNPSDGNFYATVELREVSDINLVMFSIVSSAKIDERSEHSLKDYSVGYNLSNLNSGVYLLILKAGSERKQVKIIIQ
jgi:hypothetical protein